jgi:hypothetical protein
VPSEMKERAVRPENKWKSGEWREAAGRIVPLAALGRSFPNSAGDFPVVPRCVEDLRCLGSRRSLPNFSSFPPRSEVATRGRTSSVPAEMRGDNAMYIFFSLGYVAVLGLMNGSTDAVRWQPAPCKCRLSNASDRTQPSLRDTTSAIHRRYKVESYCTCSRFFGERQRVYTRT